MPYDRKTSIINRAAKLVLVEATRDLVVLSTTPVLMFSLNTVIAWYKHIMNNWDIANKLCLLSASRAYSLQSPTCTRVTLNLVYNLVKAQHP